MQTLGVLKQKGWNISNNNIENGFKNVAIQIQDYRKVAAFK